MTFWRGRGWRHWLRAVTRILFATHESLHHVLKEAVLFFLSLDELPDARNVLRTAKNVAHKDVDVLAIMFVHHSIFGRAVANGWEAEKRCRAQANVLVQLVVSILQILAQSDLLFLTRL